MNSEIGVDPVLAGLRNGRSDLKAELEGRQALFIVNIKPRRMAGQLFEAMLLDIGYADGITPGPGNTRAGDSKWGTSRLKGPNKVSRSCAKDGYPPTAPGASHPVPRGFGEGRLPKS